MTCKHGALHGIWGDKPLPFDCICLICLQSGEGTSLQKPIRDKFVCGSSEHRLNVIGAIAEDNAISFWRSWLPCDGLYLQALHYWVLRAIGCIAENCVQSAVAEGFHCFLLLIGHLGRAESMSNGFTGKI